MFEIIQIIGTLAFAISVALTAMQKRLDLFGVFIIAFVTALGGGTLRDVLIGKTPVGWMLDIVYVAMVILGFVLAIVFKKKLNYLRDSLFLFDTIGLGVFTLVGIQKGLDVHLHPIICIAIGTMTACFGGVIRDILCNEIPVIFRKEIYATICILGGSLYFILCETKLSVEIINLISVISIISFRLLVVRYKWSLPTL
jgi:uncharacterized membrane protein YeiH